MGGDPFFLRHLVLSLSYRSSSRHVILILILVWCPFFLRHEVLTSSSRHSSDLRLVCPQDHNPFREPNPIAFIIHDNTWGPEIHEVRGEDILKYTIKSSGVYVSSEKDRGRLAPYIEHVDVSIEGLRSPRHVALTCHLEEVSRARLCLCVKKMRLLLRPTGTASILNPPLRLV